MVSDKELISKLQELRQIKPEKEWAFLTKTRILGQDLEKESLLFPTFRFLFQSKLAYVGLAFVFVLVGLFGFSQNSVPGDSLYSLRKIIEKGQAVFVSEEEKPFFQLRLAEEKLDDLAKVRAKNLAPALNEFQISISEAAKSIAAIETAKNLEVVERMVVETKRLEGKKQEISALGIVGIDEAVEGLNLVVAEKEREFYQSQVGSIIENLENQASLDALTEEKEELLAQMKELVEREQFQEAFKLYWINQ